MQAIVAEAEHRYGSRRMAKPLQDDGFAVGRHNARRLMRQAKVTVQRSKKRGPVTTDSRQSYAVAPHVLARQFDVEQPDQVWVGDITYVWTTEGWLYLAV
jgi:transposase InsO family protein